MTRKRNNKRYINNFKNYQVKNKLIIHKNFETILKRISDMGNDLISITILNDSKKPLIPTRLSWINITKSKDHLSYTVPDKVKKEGDEWEKKNRMSTEIRKLIRKIYKKQFSNKEIQNFISKFKSVYSSFIEECKYKPHENIITNNSILNNIITETENDKLTWIYVKKTNYYIKYKTKIIITENKYISINLYETKNEINFLTFHLINELKNYKKHIKTIYDSDAVWLIKNYIENKNKNKS